MPWRVGSQKTHDPEVKKQIEDLGHQQVRMTR
jgi:hypothetical protein